MHGHCHGVIWWLWRVGAGSRAARPRIFAIFLSGCGNGSGDGRVVCLSLSLAAMAAAAEEEEKDGEEENNCSGRSDSDACNGSRAEMVGYR